ncbi:MAG: CMD domain-containing protein [Rubrivivax sp.]
MATDVIDRTAGLEPGTRVHAARRFRETAISHTQASHDALLLDPVEGLTSADRLRVAVAVCEASRAASLEAHYRGLLAREAGSPASGAGHSGMSAPLAAALEWAHLLTLDPGRGDRAALQRLREAGLADPAIVALAQLVAFLSYQTRVVAGLRVLAAMPEREVGPTPDAAPAAGAAAPGLGGPDAPGGPGRPGGPGGTIRLNGFTNETLAWHAWLKPLEISQATPEQLAVLDESHPQGRSSEYYLTLVHQPRMLQHRSTAYNAIMYAAGGLPRAERELGAMVVSVTNGCVYCTSVHAQRYAQLARRTDTVVQVFTDPSSAGSTPREQAVARFARALTLRPQSLHHEDLADLQAQGLGDTDLIDLLHACAIFGWANRLMHNLGEPAGETH